MNSSRLLLTLGIFLTVPPTEAQVILKPCAEDPIKSAETLDQLRAALKKQGWEEVSIPSTFDAIKGLVAEKESLDSVQVNQKVTVKYSWVVTDIIRVPPNTERKVITGLIYPKQTEGSLKVVEPSGKSRLAGWSIGKEKAKPNRRFGMEGIVRTGNDEVLEVGLQESVEIYDSDGKLIAKGYQRGASAAQFKRVAVVD
jgi:hypothetical protein